jgi:hypothetical protein
MGYKLTICLLVALFASSGVFFVMHHKSETPQLSRETFDKVGLGMTEKEVMRLIPIPDGDKNLPIDLMPHLVVEDGKFHFRTDEVTVKKGDDGSWHIIEDKTGKVVGRRRKWEDHHYRIDMIFDPDGRVIRRTLYKFIRSE